jgi:hypothetical protein
MKSYTYGAVLSGIVIFSILFLSGCKMKEMDSRWCDRAVTIDGIDSSPEWENARYFFDDEQVTIGLMNTGSTLYVRLSTRDLRIQREILAYGFTLWFNDKGDKNKTVGIRYPMGSQGDSTMTAGNGLMNRALGHADTVTASDRHDIELFGPGKGQRSTISPDDAAVYGIICKIGDDRDNLIYELKYPLKRTLECPYGISVNQIGNLDICFETGKLIPVKTKQPKQKIRERDRGDTRPGSGMIGRNPGMDGINRRSPVGNSLSPLRHDPLEMWLKVHLAEHGAN